MQVGFYSPLACFSSCVLGPARSASAQQIFSLRVATMHSSHDCMHDAKWTCIPEKMDMHDSVFQTERHSNTTVDPINGQTIALHAVDHLCTVATAQAQVRPNQQQTVFFACWSTMIALLQTLQGPTLQMIKQHFSAQTLRCASNQLYCQHGIMQAIPAVKTAWQQCNIFCPGKRFRISSNTCGEFPILCSHYINNAEDVWRPGEALDYENGSLKLVC